MGSSGQLFRGVLALISIVYVATYIRLVLTPSIKDYMNFVKIGVLLNVYHHCNIPTNSQLRTGITWSNTFVCISIYLCGGV